MNWTAFWSHWAWPFVTAIEGLLFSYLILSQYLKRKKPHQLAWSVGFIMYAAAAAMEAYSEYIGAWAPGVYRLYIVLAASLVGFLGLGSLYLVAKRPLWGHIYAAFNLIALIIFIYGVFTVDLREELLVAGITVGGKPLGASLSFPRISSLFFNIPGSLLLLGGAVYSIFRFSRKREYAYRVWANVLILIGTIVIAGAGSMARSGQAVGLYPAEMIGLTFLLLGFLKAGTLQKGAEKIRTRRTKEAAPV